MGDDPSTSVTDNLGRFHEVRNLFALGPCFAPATRRQRPSNQNPPGSRVLLGESWPSWAPVTTAFQRLEALIFVRA